MLGEAKGKNLTASRVESAITSLWEQKHYPLGLMKTRHVRYGDRVMVGLLDAAAPGEHRSNFSYLLLRHMV